ncbi:MAG: imidazole glycerol phosphate synthase subunit HisH [Treponema sp.]|nr:imidazole glycerol phosphate synthase subunit HisH [Treponema sp.]
MTGIIDYNAGNIKSVERSLAYIKAPYILSKNPKELQSVDRIIFPGDGEAAYAMEQLKELGFDSFIKDWVQEGKPLLGICIGAQIVFDYSEEGDTQCLGLIKGRIRHFTSLWNERLPTEEEHSERAMLLNTRKVPHMGWNDVTFCNGGTKLCEGVADKSDFYFVHSYVIQPEDVTVIKGYADYGTMVPAIVEQKNITVCQFHPEKSGEPGLQILRNFTKNDIGGASC